MQTKPVPCSTLGREIRETLVVVGNMCVLECNVLVETRAGTHPWSGWHTLNISQVEGGVGGADQRVWGSDWLLCVILFGQASYQRVTLNFALSYYPSSPGNEYMAFGFHEGGLNCLFTDKSPK